MSLVDIAIRQNAPTYAKAEIISLGKVGWTLPLGGQIQFRSDPIPCEKDIYFPRGKSLGTNLVGRRLRVVSPTVLDRYPSLNLDTGEAIKNIKDNSGKSLKGKIDDDIQSLVNASEMAESKFCVSSEDGQKLYQSIRSALLDGKNVILSFEGIANISSAFLDEAISNLYNGEFDEKDLEQKIKYRGLSEEDSSLKDNIIEWAKQDFAQSAQ